jgi:hypothetical protein
MNRRVRTRTHGGVGGRKGQPFLPPDPRFAVSPRLYAVLSEIPHESAYKSMSLKAAVHPEDSMYCAMWVPETLYEGYQPSN